MVINMRSGPQPSQKLVFFVNVVCVKSGFAANCTAVCQDALMGVLTGFDPQLRCRVQSRAQLKVL